MRAAPQEKIKYLKKFQTDLCGSAVCIRCIQPPDVFPLTPIVNRSCNI